METTISKMYSDFSGHFMGIYQRTVQFYWWCMSRADPRVANWPLMASPVPTLVITLSYLITVYYGRKWMATRKPFSLRRILIPYNLSMCCLNLYIASELAVTQYRKQYNWLCQPVNYSDDPDEIRTIFHATYWPSYILAFKRAHASIASALWWYYFSRLVEMMDTVFLVLRKKWRQLTFLHVYHHSTMFMLWWIGVKWVPGGSAFFAAMVNCFIHVIMYLYYALAACGPKIQKYLYWKKYLTLLQMGQFISALVLGVRALIYGCDFPLWMQYALVLYMASFLILFGQYYRTAYLEKKQKTR